MNAAPLETSSQMPDLVEHFKVVSQRSRYFVTVTTKELGGGQRTHGIDFGGTMRGCVTMTVQTPNAAWASDPRFAFFERDKHLALISWIGYGRRCNLTNDMPGGEGTRKMVQAAMTFVLQRYPWITAFKLTDASTFVCVESFEMNLADVSWVTHGKTYYERHFGASLLEPNLAAAYAADTARLNGSLPEFADFAQLARLSSVPRDKIELLKKAHSGAATYRDLFARLKAECGARYCDALHPWLAGFVVTMSRHPYWSSYWVIPAANVRQQPLEIAVSDPIPQDRFQKGGRKRKSNGHFTVDDL